MVQTYLMAFAGCCLMMGLAPAAGSSAMDSAVVAHVLSDEQAVELDIPTDIGVQKERLPLYRSGTARYFSAGIGQVERAAIYPPFSLKLVFTAGGKPFISGVAVTLRQAKGGTVLTIPNEHNTGPWLFIDLPEGTYQLSATLGGVTQQVNNLTVRRGHVTTQHVRWAEDPSPRLPVQAE
ncbi:MAG: carboxypeptidase-like regulatory domain-containing protein [Nitrospira sp.]